MGSNAIYQDFLGDIMKKDKVVSKSILIILVMALAIAVLQTIPATAVALGASTGAIRAGFIIAGLISVLYLVFMNRKDADNVILWIVYFGALMRMGYVLLNDIWTLQNDGGTYTGFGTPDINNGHIGYAEYIYKFFHMPDMDPYDHFGYYHPPLHHILEAIWLTIQRFLGIPETVRFENMQVLTFIYSSLCMVVMYLILKEVFGSIEDNSEKAKIFIPGMALFAFYPRMMVLAGSVNNDILALLLLLCTIWRTLVWIREKSVRNIVKIALSLGFGMLSKLNTAICAFSIALIFLVAFISAIKERNGKEVKRLFGEYVLFGFVVIPIGLSYIVRNIVLFGEKPGIPSPALIPSQSVMFTGEYSVWSIIGIPTITDLHIEFPFHAISAEYMHNTWAILFQTGLFAEAYPTTIGPKLLVVAQIAYVSSIIAAIVTTIVFMVVFFKKLFEEKKEDWLKSLFLLSTYVFMLISFSLFVFKYPYTCSSDFRYMAACLVFTSIGLIYARKYNKPFGRFVGLVSTLTVALTLICSLIVYMFWEINA